MLGSSGSSATAYGTMGARAFGVCLACLKSVVQRSDCHESYQRLCFEPDHVDSCSSLLVCRKILILVLIFLTYSSFM